MERSPPPLRPSTRERTNGVRLGREPADDVEREKVRFFRAPPDAREGAHQAAGVLDGSIQRKAGKRFGGDGSWRGARAAAKKTIRRGPSKSQGRRRNSGRVARIARASRTR